MKSMLLLYKSRLESTMKSSTSRSVERVYWFTIAPSENERKRHGFNITDYQILGGYRLGILTCTENGAKVMGTTNRTMYVVSRITDRWV